MNLYGVHDDNRDWFGIIRDMASTGWAVISEEIGDDPTNHSGADYRDTAAYGVTPIVRLNYSHHGDGTIPLPSRYNAFAERCANFVTASSGCTHWIIANEPNLRAERYGDVPITPGSYAECFNKCRTQIKHRGVQHTVMPAAIAPYNADTGWCLDYWKEMLSAIILGDGGADALALHTYSRGANPSSITSEDKMDAPYQDCYSGFRAYRDFLALVPAIMRALPVYITETDQLEPWADRNSGWVEKAYAEIDAWNHGAGQQGIHCLALYRWENFDQWGFCRKAGVIDDFRNAITYEWLAPTAPSAPILPIPPLPPVTPPIAPPEPEPERNIDPKLIARGVHFNFVQPPAGTGYWRMTKAEWLENAAATVGPDHHILGRVLRDNAEMPGVPLRVDWPSGYATVISKDDQAYATYNFDYPMGPSLSEYSITVVDGNPSDIATGIGMGKDGNPREHTSTWLTFEWTISEGVTAPELPPPTPVTGRLIWPVTGPITQYFGAHEIEYPGSPGHDGIDFGVVTGTPVVAVADGVVLWVDNDPTGFGLYVRIFHPAHGFHSFMGHLSRQIVTPGQLVKQGETVGLSGSTGNSTGPHLHYSCRVGEADTYFDLHDGYHNGCANPLAVHGLINKRDPNMREDV